MACHAVCHLAPITPLTSYPAVLPLALPLQLSQPTCYSLKVPATLPPQHPLMSLLPGMLFPQTDTWLTDYLLWVFAQTLPQRGLPCHPILLQTATPSPHLLSTRHGPPCFIFSSALTTSCHVLDWNRAVRQNMGHPDKFELQLIHRLLGLI